MKALLFIFSLLLILLLARLWVGTGSYPERWRTQERTTVLKANNEKKQAQIDKMQAELNDAKSGNDAIEERARSELGMTKKGETYFEIILQPDEEKQEKIERKGDKKKYTKPKKPNQNNSREKAEQK